MTLNAYQAIIIGAGLSGLTAGVRLQNAGYKVAIIEKSSRPGGLCGTFLLNSYEFVIACNDFCEKVFKILDSLDVAVLHKKAKTRIYFDSHVFTFPPTLSTLVTLGKHPIEIAKLVWALKTKNATEESVESFTQKYVKNPKLAALLQLFAYPFGMAPRDLFLRQIQEDLSDEYQYNHQRSYIPVDGPQSIVDALVKQFTAQGGVLKLNSECVAIRQLGDTKQIVTEKDTFTAKHVISTQPLHSALPKECKKGLAVSTILIAVDKRLTFPKEHHTIISLPKQIAESLNAIDEGKTPNEYGFHFFPHYPKHADYYSIQVYIYLPRGKEQLSAEYKEMITQYVFEKMETYLPGFHDALLFHQMISVDEFEKIHKIPSLVSPIVDATFTKPSCYDAKTDIYYAGNTVFPPGNHAGAAMLSAITAANMISN